MVEMNGLSQPAHLSPVDLNSMRARNVGRFSEITTRPASTGASRTR